MTIQADSIIVRQSGLQTASVDDDLIILNMKTNNYIALDEIGRQIWEKIETPVSVKDVCLDLSKEFNASLEQINTDVIKFLQEMQTEELVHVVEG